MKIIIIIIIIIIIMDYRHKYNKCNNGKSAVIKTKSVWILMEFKSLGLGLIEHSGQ